MTVNFKGRLLETNSVHDACWHFLGTYYFKHPLTFYMPHAWLGVIAACDHKSAIPFNAVNSNVGRSMGWRSYLGPELREIAQRPAQEPRRLRLKIPNHAE